MVVLATGRAFEEADPHAGADAPHADDLPGDVGDVEPIEQSPAVVAQGRPVRLEHGLDLVHVVVGPVEVDDQRRVLDELMVAAGFVRELGHRAERVALPGLLHVALHPCPVARGKVGDDVVDVGPVVPELERRHRGVVRHVLPIRAHRLRHHLATHRRRKAVLVGDEVQARGQALDVPLPRRGQRLVEVVDGEGEVAFGRREVAEVADVGVAARLDVQSGRRCRREVECHHRRRAAQEAERRLGHARVANGHEVGQATRRLVFEHIDRIASVNGSAPVGVRRSRDDLAQLATGIASLRPRTFHRPSPRNEVLLVRNSMT